MPSAVAVAYWSDSESEDDTPVNSGDSGEKIGTRGSGSDDGRWARSDKSDSEDEALEDLFARLALPRAAPSPVRQTKARSTLNSTMKSGRIAHGGKADREIPVGDRHREKPCPSDGDSEEDHGDSRPTNSDSRSDSRSQRRESSDSSSDESLESSSLSEGKPEVDGARPPRTPRKQATGRGLASPSKLNRMPKSPFRPSMDAFWVQEFMDDWAEEHSPKKLIIPKTPTKPKAAATPLPGTEKRNREARKAFEKEKHELAARFLRELDEKVTDGRLAALTESTGGIRIVWSRTLNTTAGRATWKRERVTRGAESTGNAAPNGPSHRQHATIELAEKVIDDETRLLNVVAHEFCHLAVFMLSGAGAAAKPHGSEFKSWAARCSKAFADRGIIVTTRHDYDIAFRYAWQCESCGIEYQRHSKSIDPARHRCGGGCGGQLKQTRPAPRGTAAAASGSGRDTPQPSEYQRFVKEHMPLVRRENPGSPQKDVMRIVAARWAATKAVASPEKKSEAVVENVVDELAALSIV